MNLLPAGLCRRTKTRQLLRVMQLTAIILMIGCISVSAKGVSQITLKETNAPLQQVIEDIRKQSGYDILYNGELIRESGSVTVSLNNATLQQALDACLINKNLTYEITDKTVVIKRPITADLSPRLQKENVFPITGIVKGVDGKPLANVSVMVKGTNKGTTTDAGGKFSMEVNPGDVLVVSSVGFGSREVPILSAQSSLVIALDISSSPLDEVQIIAYGQTSRRFNTGNVTSVKASEIEKQPVQNPLLAIQGRAPGINIVQTTGFPGAGIKIRIQGQNSLSQGIDPLIVIDGIPYPSRNLPTLTHVVGIDVAQSPEPSGAGSPLSYINPLDIESIEILKDADATAIYGSRGGNGVILITTKKAKSGIFKLEFNVQEGWGKLRRQADLLNTEQYLQLRKEAYTNDGLPIPSNSSLADFTNYDLTVWDQNRFTDWQKVLVGGTSNYSNVQGSVSGGTANTQYLISGTYHRQTTVFPGDLANKKGSWNMNLSTKSQNERLHVQFGFKYQIDDNKIISTDLTDAALTLAPNAPPLYDSAGNFNWEMHQGMATWNNPASILPNHYKIRTNNLLADASVRFRLHKSLDFKIPVGYLYQQSTEASISLMSSKAPDIRPFELNSLLSSTGSILNWQVEPQISFNRNIGGGVLHALIGSTILETRRDQSVTSAFGFSSDLLIYNPAAAARRNILPGVMSRYRYNALFGRLNYVLYDRYILSANARRDGSSRFGLSNRFHNFGSGAAAWIFSSEPAFRKSLPFISFGKIRGSFGTSGNDQIGEYQYLSVYNPIAVSTPYQGIGAIVPDRLTNSNLAWEEIRKLSVGVELGFFNDRILIHADYYRNRSSNQLVNYKLPATTGFNGVVQNFPARILNYGWELSASTQNIKTTALTWKTDFNISINKNKLLDFSDLAFSTYAPYLTVGQPITIRKIYQLSGVDPATGMYQFVNKDGALTDDPGFGAENRTIMINPVPKFFGGFSSSISYKRFQLDFLFQFVKQIGQDFRFGNQPGAFSSFAYQSIGNQPVSVLDRWQKASDESQIQKTGSIYFYYPSLNYINESDKAWVDASYIRLKNLSLSWQVPLIFNHHDSENLRLFIQGQNLITITNYKGLDPETLSQGTLPPLTVITVGAHLKL